MKFYSGSLFKQIYPVLNLSICPFESGKKEKKLQKFICIEKEKSFLDEMKSHFHSF